MRGFTKGRHLILKMFCAGIVTTAALVGFASKPAQAETVERIYEFRSYWEGNQYSSTSHNQLRRNGGEWEDIGDTHANMHFNELFKSNFTIDTIQTNKRKFRLYVNGQQQSISQAQDTDYLMVTDYIKHVNSFPVSTVSVVHEHSVFGQHISDGGDYKTDYPYRFERAISQNVSSNQAQTDAWAKDPYNNGNYFTLNVKVVFDDDPANGDDGSATYVKYKDTGEDYKGEWTNRDLMIKSTLTRDAQSLTLRRNAQVEQTLANVSKGDYDITKETDYTRRYSGDDYVYYYKYETGITQARSPLFYVKLDKSAPVLDYGWNTSGLLTDKSSDALSGLKKVEIKLGDGQWQTISEYDENGTNKGSGTYLFDATAGTQQFTYRVTDMAGNVSEQSGTYKPNTNKDDSKTDPVVPGDGSGNSGDGFSAKLVR